MDKRISNTKQLCEALRVTASEGREKGAELIYCSNGVLNFVLSASNSLDILRLWHRGTNIGFLSKNGLYTPRDAFPHTFPGGMLYTCGLDNIGDREGFPVHGRMHNIPADVREIRADETGIRIVGEIVAASLFGENLRTVRTVETACGSGKVTVTDEIHNDAFREENYCVLYHVNAGYPMIDDGAEIFGDFAESTARTSWAEKHKGDMLRITPPIDNMEETCYFHRMDRPRVGVLNRKLGKKLELRYSGDTLPYLIEWKSMASGDFALGLEPATSWLDGHFSYRTVKAGETVVNRIEIEISDV
ncbi:MAG: aldose 1-epimerase family protein [Clostridia bacterium]|nr:aldose 1-epimerase family protein [Clostridia bacterium]